MKLSGQSELHEVLKFLNHKDLNLISKYKIGTDGIGKIFFQSNFTWPVKSSIAKDEFNWEINRERRKERGKER